MSVISGWCHGPITALKHDLIETSISDQMEITSPSLELHMVLRELV